MQDVLLFIVPEHMRPDNAFQLRVKMRKEVRVAQQYPVKEKNIINLQAIQHDKKPPEELQKAEGVPDAIQYNENRRTGKQQNGNCIDQPADEMCAAKALLFIRNRRRIFLRRRAEKVLGLNEIPLRRTEPKSMPASSEALQEP